MVGVATSSAYATEAKADATIVALASESDLNVFDFDITYVILSCLFKINLSQRLVYLI